MNTKRRKGRFGPEVYFNILGQKRENGDIYR